MKKNICKLTIEEEKLFTKAFYSKWKGKTDLFFGHPTPLGKPWLYKYKLELEGKDIEDMANKFFKDIKEEITDYQNRVLRHEMRSPTIIRCKIHGMEFEDGECPACKSKNELLL